MSSVKLQQFFQFMTLFSLRNFPLINVMKQLYQNKLRNLKWVFNFRFFEGFGLNCFHVFCESFIALPSILILFCEVATVFLIYDSIFLTEYSAYQYIEAAGMYFKIQLEI